LLREKSLELRQAVRKYLAAAILDVAVSPLGPVYVATAATDKRGVKMIVQGGCHSAMISAL
jgi:hypothetical protein